MRYRNFGTTGVSVSEIGFGAWAIGGSWGPQPELGDDLLSRLCRHAWTRAFWYAGK
jgi:aryl-alcohol dehydrogenase-like predicted oxidoreductase